MSFTVDVSSDLKKLEYYMDNLEKKQLPFAVSLTLNKLALKIQGVICQRIPTVFNTRRDKQWWDKRQRTGIKVQFSHKTELVAAVYTNAYFANIQEEGGIKNPYRGSNLAVPTEHVPRTTRSSNALRTTSNDKAIFKLGNSVYKRIGKGKLQRLYSLTPQAHVRARFGFKSTAVGIFNKQFDQVFTTSFNYALKTAK